MCAACDVEPAPHGGGGGGGGGGAAAVLPLLKAWTGEQFERFAGEPTRESIARWLMGYSDWRLDAAGDGTGGAGGTAPPGYEEDNSALLLLESSRGKLQPWTGQALPTQVFVPVGPRPPGGLWPVLVYFHGGNDGPWQSMAQQAFVRGSLAPTLTFILTLTLTHILTLTLTLTRPSRTASSRTRATPRPFRF